MCRLLIYTGFWYVQASDMYRLVICTGFFVDVDMKVRLTKQVERNKEGNKVLQIDHIHFSK